MRKHTEILDNFENHLHSIPDKKKQVEEIIEFVLIYGDSYGDKIAPLLEKGINISKSIGFETGEVICYYNFLFWAGGTGTILNSKQHTSHEELVEMLENIKGDIFWYSLGLNLLAYYHWFRGEYEKGFSIAFKALKFTEQILDKSTGWHYFALGIFYFDTRDFENSAFYYRKSLDAFSKFDYLYGKARASNGLASVAIQQGQTEKATSLLEYAAGIYKDFGHYSGLSRALNDMALIEKATKNYEKAIALFSESIELRKEINHVQGLITSLTELGEIYLMEGTHEKALEYLLSALHHSTEINSRQKSMRLNKLIYEAYKKMNDIPLALKYFEDYYEIKSQLMGDEATNNIKRLQTKFEKEKSEQEAEIERLKNVELKKAYEMIEQRNKDIHDSIIYASRIQRSLLPTEKSIERELKKFNKG